MCMLHPRYDVSWCFSYSFFPPPLTDYSTRLKFIKFLSKEYVNSQKLSVIDFIKACPSQRAYTEYSWQMTRSAILWDNISQPLDQRSWTLTVRSAFHNKNIKWTQLLSYRCHSCNSSLSSFKFPHTVRSRVWRDDGEWAWYSTNSNNGGTSAADTRASLLSPTVPSGIILLHRLRSWTCFFGRSETCFFFVFWFSDDHGSDWSV